MVSVVRPVTKSQVRREEAQTAATLGMTVDEFRAKYAPWRLARVLPEHPHSDSRKKRKGTGKVAPTTRVKVYERDQGLCRYCGVELDVTGFGPRMFTVDHVVPWSRGGSKQIENLAAACQTCNGRKSDQLLDECGMVLLPIGTRREPEPERVFKRSLPAHTRGHWTSRGTSKLPWTREEAIELAANLEERDGMTMEPFACDECDAWHLRILPGWSRLKHRRANDYQDSYAELGDRVTGCLRQENMGKEADRRRSIRVRWRAALKHAQRKSA
jgi:5-methylcytosine-specific restriction endonuclease McrA